MKYFKIQLYDTESKEQVQMETEAHRIEDLISWGGKQHSEIDLLEQFYFQLNNELEKNNDQKPEDSEKEDF